MIQRLLGAAAILAGLAGCAAPPPAQRPEPPKPAPQIKAETGRMNGIAEGGVEEYLGIPYAAPPVGALRWQPPKPLPKSDAEIDATKFRSHCPQAGSYFGLASADEDCLFLNVYRPVDRPAGPLPVMVWIHGGALVVGESEDFDPSPLVRQGVVAVSLNYRIGAFGWLAHPALDHEGHGFANYGLMDQQAALRWIQKNIGAFGGDARRVTIFGESAGGWSVLANMTSPTAVGLFQRGIAMSGAYAMPLPSLADGEKEGMKFAEAAGCADQSAACLRGLSVATILEKEDQWPKPAVDGSFLVGPAAAHATDGPRLPLIIGTTRDEFRLFVFENFDVDGGAPIAADQYEKVLAEHAGPAIAAKAVPEYPIATYGSADFAAAAVLTDSFFACPGLGTAEAFAAEAPTWVYEFADRGAPQNFLPRTDLPTGAAHESELQYLMGVRSQPTTPKLDAAQAELSKAMIGYWTNFAKTGDPNGPGVPPWAVHAPGSDAFQSFVPPTPVAGSGFAASHRCGFWAGLAK